MFVSVERPKCKAFIIICCIMLNTHNTNGLPFGMSNVTNPEWIQAARFLYSQYPGIHKLRIKRVRHGSRAIAIKVISVGQVPRVKRRKGYSLASAMGNLIQAIKSDYDLSCKLSHPELYEN